MASNAHDIVYRFGRFALDLRRGALLSSEAMEMPLRPKSFALLQFLVENAGRLVSREAIMETLWPNIFVTDDNISQCIRDIRRVLDVDANRMLRTVPRRGYLFAADVTMEQVPSGFASRATDDGRRGLMTGEFDDQSPIAAKVALHQPPPDAPVDPTVTDRPSIAVLAFENLSNDPEQDYFSNGVADDIITELSRDRCLSVVARTSSFAYNGRSPDMKQIARELGVSYVIDGSVRRDGNRARVTARLVDAPAGRHIWSERLDMEISSGVAARDEMIGRIVRVLFVKINDNVNRHIEAVPLQDWTPEVLVMRGRAYTTRPTSKANWYEAIRCFEQAAACDQNSIDAKLGIAWVLIANVAECWSRSATQDTARAEQLLLDVLHIDGDIAQAHSLMGVLRRLQGRLNESQRELEKALQIAPNDPRTNCQLGQTLAFLGRPEAAIPLIETSLRLAPHDPATPTICFSLGMCHLLLEHIEKAIVLFRNAQAANPRIFYFHLALAAALGLIGELDEAAAAVRRAIEISPEMASQSSIRSLPWQTNSLYITLFDKTFGAGLRRAGLPDR